MRTLILLLASLICVNADYIRPCYFTNWAKYRQGEGKFSPEFYIPGMCTHIMFAFGWMNEDYTVRNYDETDIPTSWAGPGQYAEINALKQKQAGLKTLLSIGGWTFGTRLFKGMASSQANRATFINSAIDFARKYNFDGIDIDWEYPEVADKANHASLINEFRAAAEREGQGSNRLLITAAVAAGYNKLDGYDIPAFSNSIDFICLMSYDFWGAWDGELGMNAPLYSRSGLSGGKEKWNVDWAAKEWGNRGMPRSKIIIGVGTYGRGWTLRDLSQIQPGSTGNSPARIAPYTGEAGMAAYYEVCVFLGNGGKRYWHDEHKVPYMVQADQWWSYDDQESVRIKMEYVKKEGFGGAFVWTMDLDDFRGICPNGGGKKFPLIVLIWEQLGGSGPGPQPTASPTLGPIVTTRPAPQPTFPTSGPAPGPFTCTADGFFPDPASCTSFYRCVSGTPYHFDCAPGTMWSQALLTCDHYNAALCSSG